MVAPSVSSPLNLWRGGDTRKFTTSGAMVNIRKSPHRHHHTRCIHSNTLVLLSLRLSRLYHYRFVNTCAPTLLFVFLLGYNTTHCPLGVPTRQSTIQSLGSARARAFLSHQSLDGTTIALRSPLGGTREVARATGCRSRPWGDIGLGVRKAIRYYYHVMP